MRRKEVEIEREGDREETERPGEGGRVVLAIVKRERKREMEDGRVTREGLSKV